ncbi:MAG: VCBS repeat-containing protein, partial [Verrucomicrobia bacterium]|nr:VCBS repeat-containing protein [Verrucomicrobiota bacterium]
MKPTQRRFLKSLLVIGIIFSVCLGCQQTHALDLSPLTARQNQADSPLFEALDAGKTGIDLVHRFPANAPFNMLTDQGAGSGVCVGDVDGDGLPDIFFTNYDHGNKLYRNLGDLQFKDITEKAGLDGRNGWSGGTTFVDIDNDGDLDLFIAIYNAPNLLYINRGNGDFDEQAAQFGLAHQAASVMMAFADYDRDGDLDAYLVTHRLKIDGKHILPKTTAETFQRKIIEIRPDRKAYMTSEFEEIFQMMDKGEGRIELIIAGGRDKLYRNDGVDGFKDVSKESGISGFDIGLAATWWDYNDDGWPDLYVSNDYKGSDKLYKNNQDGSFTEIAKTALPHIPWYSMGCDTADINNDGFIDLFATDMSGTSHYKRKIGMGDMRDEQWFMKSADPRQYMRNALYLSTGTERVFEAASMMEMANTDWSWSPKFGDFDNDGKMDLFVSNGMSRDFMNSDLAAVIKSRYSEQWRQTPILKQRNLLFQNSGNLTFKEVGEDWGMNQSTASYGAAASDLDRDGDLDLIVTNFDEPISIFRNNESTHQSIAIRLNGQKSNRWGIGTKVKITMNDGSLQVRTLGLAQGFMSSNEPILHFGLEANTQIKSMSVQWPTGSTQKLTNLPAGQFLTITEPDAANSKSITPVINDSFFKKISMGITVQHRERDHDDYQTQPLLPWKLSQSGPGLAVGDVDGNGVEDIFVSGAAGQTGQLLLRYKNAPPKRITTPFNPHLNHEDMGALFFDLEGDGDLDLYVVSGGVECAPSHSWLQDRVYLNDGKGRFESDPSKLPDMRLSGSSVAAADFDQDGDLDLFVGGFSKPGSYPIAERNVLLRNEKGTLVEVSDTVAPSLANSGLVKGAIWSDVNLDGWIDLLVCHHWGPVRYFQNQKGILIDTTDSAGLSQYAGLWNGIAGADIDNDGDMDYAVTNLGLNTKYHATKEKPFTIFYGDMDGSGKKRLIEAEFEGDKWYPVRGKSCSTLAMPSLQNKFPNFGSFAIATLEEIYPPSKLNESQRFDATHLQSGVFINDGRGHFDFNPFPRLAQITASYGIAFNDMDGDGFQDLLLSQNSYAPQLETGHFDAGQGIMLSGLGNGQFEAVWPKQSGFSFPGDAKSLTFIDWNADAKPDVLISRNNDTLLAFENQPNDGAKS